MSSNKIAVGLIAVGLEGEHNELAVSFRKQAVSSLKKSGVTVVNPNDTYTLTGEDVLLQRSRCQSKGADAIVFLIGTWCLSDHVVDAVRELALPFVVWGIPEPVSFSSVGANVVHGALDEMEIRHRLIYGMPDDVKTLGELCAFLRAAAVVRELAHARLGLIGGRTISAYPTSADPNQIKKIFGTEVEHIDQLTVLEKAKKVSKKDCDKKIAQMKQRYGSVKVPKAMLQRSVSIYFALKEVIREQRLDMLTIKCIGEFMDAYASCCVALSMLNDEGFVCGCQCNINALLSSYIVTHLSGQPNFFGDVNSVDIAAGTMRLINCGSIPGKLAPSDADVQIVPQYAYMGAGRGACTLFCMKEGPVTAGTLGRDGAGYVMNIAAGHAYAEEMEELVRVRSWAQGFVKLDSDPMTFYQNIRCNHSVVGYGNIVQELLEFCHLLQIRPETTNRPLWQV